MRYFCTAGLLVFLLMAFVPAVSAEQYEYKEYQVIQGDTLWDISLKELQNSFQWPLIWKENPDIKDPDRIYPGKSIKIPIGIKELEGASVESLEPVVTEEAVPKAQEPVVEKTEQPVTVVKQPAKPAIAQATKIQPVKKGYLLKRGALLLAGYISLSPPDKGSVIKGQREGTVFGTNDNVYIKTAADVKRGDMFFINRKQQAVTHPKTKVPLGYLIETVGTLRVESVSPDGIKATIIESLKEIHIGDILDTYHDIDLPFVLDEPRKPQVEGFIIAASNKRTVMGQLDIVYIDKGTKDGLEAGDVLVTIIADSKAQTNGIIQIINPKESTSAAVIVTSSGEIMIGDAVAGMK